MSAPPVIRLSPKDNVVVSCRALSSGERFAIDGHTLTVVESVPIGHKIALRELSPGDKVMKYGMPIGSMTNAAEAGEWVHIHNMKSDYMPAHFRDAAGDHA